MYTLLFTENYQATFRKIIKGSAIKEKRHQKVLGLLQGNPSHPSLKSHRVATRNFGVRWSSWITGDLRIIWDFDDSDTATIALFAITSHSGKQKEYK